jgi:hypothetical protein
MTQGYGHDADLAAGRPAGAQSDSRPDRRHEEDQMHEGLSSTPQERPIDSAPSAAATPRAERPIADRDAMLDDPRLLTILSTEHWSLLSARSLAYNEAFTRAGMFFTLLSTSLVALAFLAGVIDDGRTALTIAAVVLGVVFLVGVLTAIRIIGCNEEDGWAMHGMNRIRNAYVQIVPEVEPFLITDIHDDVAGISRSYGFIGPDSAPRTILYGLSTSGGLVVIVDGIVGGATAAAVVLATGGPLGTAFAVGVAVAVVAMVLLAALIFWLTYAAMTKLTPRYPSPGGDAGAEISRRPPD